MGFKNNNGLLLYSKNSLIKFEIGDDHIPRQKSHPSQKYPDGTGQICEMTEVLERTAVPSNYVRPVGMFRIVISTASE